MAAIADTSHEHWFLSPENLVQLGQRIAKQRARKGWSQRELGRRTAIDSSRLSRIENGRCIPRLEEMVRLRITLGVDLDELVFGRAPDAPAGRLERLARALEEVGDRTVVGVVERLIECLIHEPATAPDGVRISL